MTLNSSESLTVTMIDEKEIQDEITKYTKAKSIEIFRKGPKSVDVEFYLEGMNIIVHEPYNKTEMSLLMLDDIIITGAIMTLRLRVCNIFFDEFETEIGAIVNRKVHLLSPEFDNREFSILYRFKYLDN